MRVALREAWVKGLNLDRYPQGRVRLRGEAGRYCPLGVLVDVADPFEWNNLKSDASWLRPEFARFVGLKTANGAFELDWLLGQEDIWLPIVEHVVRAQRIRGFARIDDIIGKIKQDDETGRRLTSISQLTDRGVPFSVIGQIILGAPPSLYMPVSGARKTRSLVSRGASQALKTGT